MALISRGYPTKATSADLLIVLFNEFLEEHPEYRDYLPVLTEETARGVIAKLNMKVKTQVIVDYVMGRYALIK